MSHRVESSLMPSVLVARALVLFLAIDIGFRLFGFNTVVQTLLRRANRTRRGRHGATQAPRVVARRTFEAVCLATRYYYRKRLDCLPKALTTYYLLRLQGVRADLCIGVKRFPFAGHAWVEVEGERLDDSPRALFRAGAYLLVEKL